MTMTLITEPTEVKNPIEFKNLTVSRLFENKRKDVLKAIEKLNKKCDRLGVSHPTVTLGETYIHTFSDGTLEDDPFAAIEGRYKRYSIDVFDIEISLPEEMKMGDWEAIAFIEHREGQHIQFDIDADYDYDFNAAILDKQCEHCNTKRYRRKSFVLKSLIDGSFKKVGSTCVKDFTGVDPTKFMKAFQHITRTLEYFCDPEFNRSTRTLLDYRVFDIDQIWTISKNVLSIDGEYVKSKWEDVENPPYSGFYTKVRTNEGEATADKVKGVLFNYNEDDKYFVKSDNTDTKLAKKMRKWLAGIVVRKTIKKVWTNIDGSSSEVEVENEFDAKMKGYYDRKRVRTFDIGFTSWIVDAYLKYEKSLSAPVSEFQGEVGTKIPLEVTVTSLSGFDSIYGWTNVYKMVDAKGNVYSKFGTINARYSDSDEVKVGSVLKMNAEVKKHNEYKGNNETILGRVSKYKK